MIKIECSGCRYDLNTGDSVFCEDCMSKAENTIEILEGDIEKLKEEIEKLQEE